MFMSQSGRVDEKDDGFRVDQDNFTESNGEEKSQSGTKSLAEPINTDVIRTEENDFSYIETLSSFWNKVNQQKMMIGSDQNNTIWELNFNNQSILNKTKGQIKLLEFLKKCVNDLISKPKKFAIVLLVLTISAYFATKLFFAQKISFIIWKYLEGSGIINFGADGDKQQQVYYIESSFLVRENQELFRLVNRSWNSQKGKASEKKFDELLDKNTPLTENHIIESPSKMSYKKHLSECDIEELFKMIEILFVHVLKSPERKRVEKYLKSVSNNKQNTINLTYDFTNSDVEKFIETRSYVQTLFRVNHNDKLILLETENNEVKKQWEIKLDGSDFITIGLVTSQDSSYVNHRTKDDIIRLLENEVKHIFKAIYDTSKHNTYLATATNNYLYEQMLTINFDITDCNQANGETPANLNKTSLNRKLFINPNLKTPKKKVNRFLSQSTFDVPINSEKLPLLLNANMKKKKEGISSLISNISGNSNNLNKDTNMIGTIFN